MSESTRAALGRFPLIGPLAPGTARRLEVALPGAALQDRWPVTAIAGAQPGPAVFINAGVHGGEYPAIEAVIRLSKLLDPRELAGTVVLMPVVNLPAFWQRSMFVCPVDGLNPNRTFPGDPDGSYTEQLVHAVTTEFIARADYYIDLHGGDMVEDLAPFTISRRGDGEVDRKARELAEVFGLPYHVLADSAPSGQSGMMSFLAAAERGVPGFIAEAGGVGQLQPEAVDLLTAGVRRVLGHVGVLRADVEEVAPPTVLSGWHWLYSRTAGMFYPSVAVDDEVREGQVIGTIGSLFGDTLEEIVAPATGRVLFLTTSPAVTANGLLLSICVR